MKKENITITPYNSFEDAVIISTPTNVDMLLTGDEARKLIVLLNQYFEEKALQSKK